MSLQALLIAVLFGASLPAVAQDQGRRIELEESLQSRYRLTTLGGGVMGLHGENNIRKAGGVVVLLSEGLYGSYDRSKLASNAVRDGKASFFSGDKDMPLARGEKFYVTAIHVGTGAVTMGLLSARMIPGNTKNAQVWASVNFFFSKDTLAQGDIGKVYAVIDQWLVPEGTPAASPPPAPPTPAVPAAAPPSNPVDLTPGMSRDDIVRALGAPVQETGFGDHRWMTYPGMTVTLQQGKLASVERNSQPLVPVKISSDPDGADVFLDGNFVSSTPTVLRLQPGTYKIAVKLSGFKDWERDTKVLQGAEVNLHAKLTK